jgi:AcrR family transcriptional regulator
MPEPARIGARGRGDTRDKLLAAARRLFAQRGYHATRPQDVAREAGVAIGTFYLYFADKWLIFRAFVEQAHGELRSAVSERTHGVEGVGPRLHAALDAVLDYGSAHPGVLRAAFTDPGVIGPEAGGEPTLADRLAADLAHDVALGQRAGRIHADYDPELIARAIVGMMHQAAIYSAREGAGRRALLENVTRFCVRGLVPGAGV